MESLQEIATTFIKTYYVAMEQERSLMLQFYMDNSIMTFEGEHSQGLKAIKDKIEGFGFKKVNILIYFNSPLL